MCFVRSKCAARRFICSRIRERNDRIEDEKLAKQGKRPSSTLLRSLSVRRKSRADPMLEAASSNLIFGSPNGKSATVANGGRRRQNKARATVACVGSSD